MDPAVLIMIPEPGENAPASPERHEHEHGHSSHHHRRHHRKRAFYDIWIYPHRRELKNFVLFCGAVILGYLLWAAIAK
ncbi:MAG: hypothetical protein WCC59_12055 [Terriglobales bacterium]